MGLHIEWPNWNQALCESEDWRRWRYYDVKAQYEIYIRDDREEDFKELYCPKCLDLFLNLISLSSDERREVRNRKWEEQIDKKYGEYKVTLKTFEKMRLDNMPYLYERYRWVKSQEEYHKVENIRLHSLTLQLYHEATIAYINRCSLSSILAIGSAIDQFIRQLVDPRYEQREWINNKENLDTAVKEKFISRKLKREILNYKKIYRDQVAHPKVHSFTLLGMTYDKEEDYWKSPSGKPISTGPEVGVQKGIKLFCKLVNYYVYTFGKLKDKLISS